MVSMLRGLFRVHQFNKLEMYMYCLPEQSRDMRKFFSRRIVAGNWYTVSCGKYCRWRLGAPAAKKYDIEYWSPADEKYRELTSCSNCMIFRHVI